MFSYDKSNFMQVIYVTTLLEYHDLCSTAIYSGDVINIILKCQ